MVREISPTQRFVAILKKIKLTNRESSSISFLNAFFHTIISRILIISISFAAGVIVARILGPENRGILAVVVATSQIFSRLGGILISGNSILLGEKNERLSHLALHTIIWGILLSLLLYILFSSLPSSLVSKYFTEYDLVLIFLTSIFVFCLILEMGLRDLLMALQKFHKLNYINTGAQLVYFFLIVVFLAILDYGLYFAVIAILLVALFKSLLYLKTLNSRILFPLKINFTLLKESYEIGARAVITSIPIILLLKSDIWILSYYKELKTVGLYQISASFCGLFLILGQVLNQIIKAKAVSEEGGANRALLISKLLFISGVFIYIPFLKFGEELFLFVYGEEYIKSYKSAVILFVAIIFWSASISIGGFVIGKGRYPSFIARGMIIVLIINIIFNIILIPPYNESGAAYASLLSYIVGSIIYFIRFINTTNFGYKDVIYINNKELLQIKRLFKRIVFKKNRSL